MDSTKLNVLPNYNSTKELTTRFNDYYYVFFIPPLLALGFITNLLSIIVIIKIIKGYKDKRQQTSKFIMFKYMFLKALIDFSLSLILSFAIFARCGIYCSFGFNFYSKMIEIYVFYYFCNAIILWDFLLEISFAVHRLRSFSKNKENHHFISKVIILLITSLIFSIPRYLLTYKVIPIGILRTNNETIYSFDKTDYLKNKIGQILLFIWTIIRSLLLNLVFITINLTVLYKFKFMIKSKLKYNHTSQASYIGKEQSVTRMLLITNFYYLTGSLPNSLTFFFSYFLSDEYHQIVTIITNTFLLFSRLTNFFLYLCYNIEFRDTFLNLLRKNAKGN